MKHYELLFVLKPTLTEEEKSAKFDFVKGVMEKNGCEIKSVKDMGTRKLAYEIQKYERGQYFVIYYIAPPSSINEIIRNLRLAEDVIRFLNIKYEKKKDIAQWEKLVKGIDKKANEKKDKVSSVEKKEDKPEEVKEEKEEEPKE